MKPVEALVITPNANDGTVALEFLHAAGIAARACASLDCIATVDGDIGCVVLVEEALVRPEIDHFLDMLTAQPAWSDLPLVLIASEGAALASLVERVFPQSGNVAVLARPMNPVTLVSAVRVGLRARERQLQVRDLLGQREDTLRRRDEFLAMLGHELRNPLAPMRNAVYLMKRLNIEDPNLLKVRDLIDRQVGHMSRLVDDLLDVSRLELGKVQLRKSEIDLNDAIRNAAEACRPLIEARKHRLDLVLASDELLVRADPVRLEQIVCNLVTNAAKFTPDGGAICVESSGDAYNARAVVRDTGIGIEPAMLGAVFELFAQDAATLERSAGGLGIGLTIVRRLIEMHGGSITVASEGRDRGAQFTVVLPRQRAVARAASSTSNESIAPRRCTIVVVEDNPDIRESFGMLLEEWGHCAHFAASGPEGVELVSSVRPDIALVDIGLPGLNGYEVAQRIRSLPGAWADEVKLVALTGYGRDADRDKALQAGFDRHLVKPVDPDVLAGLLKTVNRDRAAFAEAQAPPSEKSSAAHRPRD